MSRSRFHTWLGFGRRVAAGVFRDRVLENAASVTFFVLLSIFPGLAVLVSAYGLFAEHTQQYQTLWNANGGRVYFYQSEMPYDPPSPEAWSHDGITGYASYKVAPGVTTHEAWGLGIYCVFRGAPVIAHTAIEAPEGPHAPGVKFHHIITIRLNGLPESGIAHVINDRGDPVVHSKKATLDR